MCGFFLALSGGIDSCATATIVFSMCRLVYHAMVVDPNEQVLKDARKICAKDSTWLPESPQEICNHILHTAFMGTTNSSKETRQRAKDLVQATGAYHTDLDIQRRHSIDLPLSVRNRLHAPLQSSLRLLY